jgi:peptidoglycan/LPS O-acetylase OafA/YrhL
LADVNIADDNRFVFLDGLRGLAAICVMIYHYTLFTNFPVFFQAGISVDFFFCLSGFVIASGYSTKILGGMSFNKYGLKRLYRLYPTFLIGLVVGFVAIVLKIQAGQTSFDDAEAVKAFCLNALFLPFFHHGYVLNFNYELIGEVFPFDTSYWSLFFELFVNMIFFFAIKNARSSALLYALALAVFGFAILKYNAVTPGWGTNNFLLGFPRVLVGFFGGVLVFKLYKKLVASDTQRIVAAIAYVRSHSIQFILGLSLLFILACRGVTHGVRFVYFIDVMVMPAIVLVSAFVATKSPRLNHWMSQLGIMSYPVYCLQYPMLHLVQAINRLDGLKLGMFAMVAISMVCTVAASYFIFDYIDQNVPAFLGRRFMVRS